MRRHARQTAKTELRSVCQPWLHPRVPHTTLCHQIVRYLESHFVFVTEPDVPPTNQCHRKGPRHLIISRKISAGTRSVRGTQTKKTLWRRTQSTS